MIFETTNTTLIKKEMKRQKITYEKLSELTEISISTLKDILALKEKTGHSTVAVTTDGTAQGKLVGKEVDTTYKYKRFKDATDGLTDYEIEQIFQYIDFIKFKDNKEKTD